MKCADELIPYLTLRQCNRSVENRPRDDLLASRRREGPLVSVKIVHAVRQQIHERNRTRDARFHAFGADAIEKVDKVSESNVATPFQVHENAQNGQPVLVLDRFGQIAIRLLEMDQVELSRVTPGPDDMFTAAFTSIATPMEVQLGKAVLVR